MYNIHKYAKIKNKNLHKNGDFMADTITLVFNIICLVFIFFGFFWGLIRGSKKTLSRGLFLLLLTVVTLFVTAPITKLILQIPINFNINIDGVTSSETMTLAEFLSQEVETLLGNNFVTKYPDFTSAIISIPMILINAIIYVVVFWILKIILFPLNALFTKLFFNARKPKEAMGFASLNNSEYPNSDKSIEPLMDIYNKTQTEKDTDGMFIQKEDEISKPTPTGITDKANVYETTQVETPKTKKELRKERKEQKKANKPKKHRLLGAGLGMLVGVLVLFNTMIPVFGIMDILKDSKSATISNMTEEEMSLSQLSGGLTDDIIKGYELSAIGRISKYIGMEQLGLIAFDQITSTKIDNKKVVLRKDLNSLVSTVTEADTLMGEYKTISDKGIENITQEELDSLISRLDTLIKSSEKVVLVDALSSYIIPVAVEYIVYNEIQLSENPVINDAIVDTLVTIAQENDIAIFEELSTIVDIAKYLSDQKLLYPIVTSKYDNILTVFDNLDDNFGETLTNKLFNLKTVNTTIPNILDMGLTIMDELTKFGYVEGSITSDTAKATFSSLFSSIASIGKSLSYDSSIYVTDSSLPAIGRLLDTFKNSGIFTQETYDHLLEYAVKIIRTQTSSLIPTNLKNSFNNHLLRNVYDVTSWQSEMETIYNALQILRDPQNGIIGAYTEGDTLRNGYTFNMTVNEDTLINIGKALDVLENSVLLGSNAKITIDKDYSDTTFISLFTSILKQVNETMFEGGTSSTLQKLGNIITTISNNFITSEHQYSSGSTFWQDEMTSVSSIIVEIYNIVNSEDISITSDLGTALDKSTHSVMLGNDSTLDLMHTLVEIIKDELVGADYEITNDGSTKDNICQLLLATLDNLDTSKESGKGIYDILKTDNNLGTTTTGDGKFWEKEMTSIIAMMDIAEDVSNITTIQGAKNIASDLDQVYESRIIPKDNLNKIIADLLRDFRLSDTTAINQEINSIIDEIATTISTAGYLSTGKTSNFWQMEFEHFSNLSDLSDNINSDIFSSDVAVSDLTTLGRCLDSIAFNTKEISIDDETVLTFDNTQNSQLITRSMINRLIVSAFDMAKIDGSSTEATMFNNLITSIQTSITNNTKVIQWERELAYISTLVQLNSNEEYKLSTASDNVGKYVDLIGFNTLSNGDFADIQYNSDGEIISSNIYSYQEDNTTKYYNSTIITRDILQTTINSLLDTFKTSVTDRELTNEEEIGNELIENLKTKVNTTSTSNSQFYTGYKVAFSELNDVKTKMDTLTSSITKDNIETTDGSDIDNLLSYFQGKKISGVLTTRKIALLIANKVKDIYASETGFDDTEAGKYLSSLISHYNDNITSDTAEEYKATTGTLNTFANPFAILKSKIDNINK